ncbi:hypothetical protein E4T50_13755 [Aureobasidium sp. EXF-12298]|nr:hypothetical protein E4T50_13755 [Aureobasidium sp. EXF-12298]KAI4751112.1 hypothetical protein E4T51_15637 [Aureobasidium sp. EXF-12344]KAI4771497.1 hypothetical protein E4T52_13490 [Aureobasidium sp. EXF-3400]
MGHEEENKKAWEKGGAKYSRYVAVALLHRHHRKAYSEYFDPCQEAADRSLRCLRRNGGDKALCQDYFEYARLHSKLSSDAWTNNETEHTMAEMKEEKRKQGRWW